jgi:glycosyltransferase involved in cell wall biosynthesis
MVGSPRILYVSEVMPGKAAFGGELRCLNILRALQQMGTVEVVVLDSGSRESGLPPQAAPDLVSRRILAVTPRPNSGPFEKLKWTLDPRANYPHGCGVEQTAMQHILRDVKKFDLVWFFKIRSPDMFPNASWQNSVVDIDDIPSRYERAVLQKGGGTREYLSALRRLFSWRRREKLLGDRFTVLTVCSEEDRRYLRKIGIKVPVHIVPNGFERPAVEPVRAPTAPPRIGFIGLFDYLPNRDGVHWFVNECWQSIKRALPDARLRLVGSGSDGPLKPHGPDIDGLGWLENPSDEIRTWSLMVVPIRMGAGTRIKIAQGFSQKCPIVSTTFGAYGYGAENGREMYLADTAEAFSKACIQIIRDPGKTGEMAERAWNQFLEKWTWDGIRPLVWAVAEDCLRQRVGAR